MWHTPQARTATSASPGPGSGTTTVSTDTGAPFTRATRAFTIGMIGKREIARTRSTTRGSSRPASASAITASGATLATPQIDPPAHWAPEQAAIDEIPASYAVRPLVVVNIAPQVKQDPQYFVRVADIKA